MLRPDGIHSRRHPIRVVGAAIARRAILGYCGAQLIL